MNTVYVNNYRGFKRTTLPIYPVNFLVGENSTGKTSMLALLELLSVPDFWFDLDFNGGTYEFGGYRDIVSAGAEDQTEFQVGIFKPGENNPNESICYMMHFREAESGLPRLVFFSHYGEGYLATMRLSRKRISARISTEVPSLSEWGTLDELFQFLQDDPPSQKSGYKFLSGGIRGLSRRSPVYAFPRVLRELFGDDRCADLFGSFPFPGFARSFGGLAPIRTTPKRTYDGYAKPWSADGEHTPYVIRSNLSSTKAGAQEFVQNLEAYGEDSGLFRTIGITQFGKRAASPFELTVALGDRTLRINSVGYGISQVLPVVVEALTRSNAWLAIQQPEVHLHPKAQAALGQLLFRSAVDRSLTLFIETHSDYVIDRFRLHMRDNATTGPFAQVVFFERKGEHNTISPMEIDSLGDYPDEQTVGFRDFFLLEQRRILGI